MNRHEKFPFIECRNVVANKQNGIWCSSQHVVCHSLTLRFSDEQHPSAKFQDELSALTLELSATEFYLKGIKTKK